MAAASNVNMVLSNIRNLVYSSGLHFVINHTPFSSYITIRKKLVIPECEILKSSTILEHDHQITDLNKHRFTNASLKEALVHLEEEMDATLKRNRKTVANLLSRIDHLETANEL